jgi:hypothetical protein
MKKGMWGALPPNMFDAVDALVALTAFVAKEDDVALLAVIAVVANELDTAFDELTAKEALIAIDDDVANEAVPNKEPVKFPLKLPVKDPVLYEEVKELNELVVTNEPDFDVKIGSVSL